MKAPKPPVTLIYMKEYPWYLDFAPTQLARGYRTEKRILPQTQDTQLIARQELTTRVQREIPTFAPPYAVLAEGRQRTAVCCVSEEQRVSGYRGISLEGYIGQEYAGEALVLFQRRRGFHYMIEFLRPGAAVPEQELLPVQVLQYLKSIWDIERKNIRIPTVAIPPLKKTR